MADSLNSMFDEEPAAEELLVEPAIIEEQLLAERNKEEQSHVSFSSSAKVKAPAPAKKAPTSSKDLLKKEFNVSSLKQASIDVPASLATSGGVKKKWGEEVEVDGDEIPDDAEIMEAIGQMFHGVPDEDMDTFAHMFGSDKARVAPARRQLPKRHAKKIAQLPSTSTISTRSKKK
ncbi:hypothetical protein K7X08_011692 [Anisodus acutangulus]|uniref:Uncharacterized protein n=1 Tax=Anisodus acutangulus TaxID=402998 RepID=A0A9Q1RM54_9SOLA|nr:hypothetical protein K7X08_011692 [Anisodus acutangulus]